MGLCCVLRWHLQPSVPFLVLHRVRAGRPAIHSDPHHSPVPFLVLHRVWAGEGNFEKQSWCYTELGQGKGILRSNPLSLSWCYTELGLWVWAMTIEEVGGL